MKQETLKALRASIAHWRRMATDKRNWGERPTARQCALCRMFLLERGKCDGCPVYQRTGSPNCEGTPYESARLAEYWEGIDSRKFRLAAKDEVRFLQSLLPRKRKMRKTKA